MKVAVVGATGVVGETILRVLEERRVPVESVGRFASRTRGDVHETTPEALAQYDAVFFASSEDASEKYAPPLLERGAVVIDNSSTFRMREDVPLIVPEVNAHALRAEHRLFPVGNCTAIILCVALAPVRDTAGLASVQVSTYQAISGAGRAALEQFDRSEGNVVRNVVPQIGEFGADGYTGEELKIAAETRKILELPDVPVFATAVRVPVRTAHSEAVFFQTQRDTSVEELYAALERAPGIVVHRDGIVTPREVEGTDLVHVARLRPCGERAFAMWIVGDQLRKGAATNGVQILELLLQRGSTVLRQAQDDEQ
ncbi:MAG TPA: Asd/ArgC dimerization domain-containing protein [Candidatus Baltobacteraceae bacterium]|nr:Asd/ArgC dimerization domain-containing protein [Candidatus Baltobacteraceae bacterium]